MATGPRRIRSLFLKARTALAAAFDGKIVSDPAVPFGPHPSLINQKKDQLKGYAPNVLDDGARAAKEPVIGANCLSKVIDTTTPSVRLGYSIR